MKCDRLHRHVSDSRGFNCGYLRVLCHKGAIVAFRAYDKIFKLIGSAEKCTKELAGFPPESVGFAALLVSHEAQVGLGAFIGRDGRFRYWGIHKRKAGGKRSIYMRIFVQRRGGCGNIERGTCS